MPLKVPDFFRIGFIVFFHLSYKTEVRDTSKGFSVCRKMSERNLYEAMKRTSKCMRLKFINSSIRTR